jgi:hypothetical protein
MDQFLKAEFQGKFTNHFLTPKQQKEYIKEPSKA